MNHISPVLQYSLWLLVLVRLALPFSLPSPIGVMNAVPEYNQNIARIETILTQAQIVPIIAGNSQSLYPETQGYIPPNQIDTQYVKINNVNPIIIIFSIWLVVFIAILARIIINNIIFARKIRREAVLVNGLDCGLPVYIMDSLPSPCLFGILKPKIIISAKVNDQNLVKYVLAHELCHYRYKDNWISLLRSLSCAVYWFNPLVWIAAHVSKMDCEMACDERVIKDYDDDERINYGKTLLLLVHGKKENLLTLSTAVAGKNMKRRILMIAKKRKPLIIMTILCLILFVSIGAVTFAGAETKTNNARNQNIVDEGQKVENKVTVAPKTIETKTYNDKDENVANDGQNTEKQTTTANKATAVNAIPDELTNGKTYKDFFILNAGKSYDFLTEAYKNNFFVILDEPVTSNSNGVSMALSHYLLTPEHSRIVFKVSGVPENKIESKVNENPDYAKLENDYTSGSNFPFIISKLILEDEDGKILYNSTQAYDDSGQPNISLFSNLYEKSDGVFLEIALEDLNENDRVNLRVPNMLNIEIHELTFGSSSPIDGQWKFELTVDDMFKNTKTLSYETTNPEYCDENGIYVDKFDSTVTSTKMELTIDNSKNSIQKPAWDNDIILFQDPDTTGYKMPYEQKLFIEVNGEQLFQTTEVLGHMDGYEEEKSYTLTKYVGEYYWSQQTDRGTKYFLYLPTLYFANAENVIVRVLDENRKPLEVNLRLNKNSSGT
jgi:beta-lactamase regulating signal transducer with metallopeptidase domain